MSGPNRFERMMIAGLSSGFNDNDSHHMLVGFYDSGNELSYRWVSGVARRFGCSFEIERITFGIHKIVFSRLAGKGG